MTANKMPEMPEADGFIGCELDPDSMREAIDFASAEAYGRACYLAGIEAAKACVPEFGTMSALGTNQSCNGWDACRNSTLTNLTALEQEAKK